MTHPTEIPSGVSAVEADVLAELARDALVLECGSWYGFSTVVMGRTARRLYAVDWHHGDAHAGERDTLHDYMLNLARYGLTDTVQTVIGRFETVLEAFRPDYFDGAFLDGMHDAASVARDLGLVAPFVARSGCWFAIHDYIVPADWHFEVQSTVDGWLVEHPEWKRSVTVDKLLVLRHR